MPHDSVMGTTVSLADDNLLQEAWGRSANELEMITGIPGAKAIARVKYLLSQRDVYNTTEQEAFVFFELVNLKNTLSKMLNNDRAKFEPKFYSVLLDTLTKLGERIDSVRDRKEAELKKIEQTQALTMMAIVEKAYYKSLHDLEAQFPDLPVYELTEVFQKNIRQYAIEKDLETPADAQ